MFRGTLAVQVSARLKRDEFPKQRPFSKGVFTQARSLTCLLSEKRTFPGIFAAFLPPRMEAKRPLLSAKMCRLFSASHNDDWKKNTNYFNDHWNREMFGPVNRKFKLRVKKKDPRDFFEEPHVENQKTIENDMFWVKRSVQLSERLNKGKKYDRQNPVFKAVPKAPSPPPPCLSQEEMFGCSGELNDDLQALELFTPPPAADPIVVKTAAEGRHTGPDAEDEFNPKFSPLVDTSKPEFKPGQSAIIGSNIQFSRKSEKSLEVPGPKLPSVSKILKETMPEDAKLRLLRWEERLVSEIGREAFDNMTKTTLLRGERLHYNLERYLDHQDISGLEVADSISKNHIRSISPHLEKFARPPLAVETSVIHPTLGYKGYTDCVTVVQDLKQPSKSALVLIDWKTSSKQKTKIGSTFDNPLQIAAYVGAFNHDKRYPVCVEKGMIVVVYNDGSPATLLPISKSQLQKYWCVWLQRLRTYSKMMQ